MFGDERASAKEIGKFVFGVASMSGPTSDSCKSRNYWVSSHTSNLAQLATRILRYEDGGARAHVQRCPTPPLTCGKHVLSDAKPTYQI